MKTLLLSLLFALVLTILSCDKTIKYNNKVVTIITDSTSAPIIDSINTNLEKTIYLKDSILLCNNKLVNENDSIKEENTIMSKKLLHNKLILDNARYYLNITIKNPDKDVFLKGWMTRALIYKDQNLDNKK